ncbi:MAG: PrgI family protein [Candidatus Paceibacterota bacterium]|jgi:hypothetical protein
MEYQVPQFIDVEDKIIGPLTLKQFIYLAGSAGLCIVFFAYLSFVFALLFSLPVAGFGAALAFYKINGKPFIDVLEAGFNYYVHEKLLLWRQSEPNEHAESTATTEGKPVVLPERGAPRLTRGKLSELAWSLDVKPTPPVEKQ